MRVQLKYFLLLMVALWLPLYGFAGLFNINIAFDAGMNEGYKSAFIDAKAFWESNITGYRSPVEWGMNGVTINATVEPIDGVSGILGSAGPESVAFGSTILDGDTAVTRVSYALTGSMTFDSADVDRLIGNGAWEAVIRHEMAHVIGFGTLWGINLLGNIYNDFYVKGSGAYTGAAGLAAYQAEFDPWATFVPVELGGGAGTADGHWAETLNGAGLTGITTADGDDLRDELMTGWLNRPTFLSDTTLGQFYDMGYTVVPEPATMFLIMGVASVTFFIRRCFNMA